MIRRGTRTDRWTLHAPGERAGRLLLALALALLPQVLPAATAAEPTPHAAPPPPAATLPPAPIVLAEVTAPPQGNVARRERFIDLLTQAGAAQALLVEQPVREATARDRNVFTLLPGREDPEHMLVVAAHTDTQREGTGAVDNWSGAVMLVALYGHFLAHPPRHTLLFIGFASEEHQGQGSQQFVRDLAPATRASIRAMVNLECLGVETPCTWANRSADALESHCQATGRDCGIAVRRQALFGYRSDAHSFDAAGIPAVTVHSLSPNTIGLINGPRDLPDRIDRTRYDEAWALLVTYLARLDAQSEALPAADSERTWSGVPTTLFENSTNLSGADGVCITALTEASPERQAGIRSGDILTHIAGVPVRSRQDLLPVLLTLQAGTPVPIALSRRVDRSLQAVQVQLCY